MLQTNACSCHCHTVRDIPFLRMFDGVEHSPGRADPEVAEKVLRYFLANHSKTYYPDTKLRVETQCDS